MTVKRIKLNIVVQIEGDPPQKFEISGNLDNLPLKLKFLAEKFEAEFKYKKQCEPQKYYSKSF